MTLASELHEDHPDAVAELIDESTGRIERKWFENGKGDEQLYQFLLQNRSAVASLRDTKGMTSLAIALRREIPSLPGGNFYPARARLEICPFGWDRYMADVHWPVFMRVTLSGETKTRFDLALCWKANNAKPDKGDEARQRLTKIISKFGTHSDSRWRRVIIKRNMTIAVLKKAVVDLNALLAEKLGGDQ